MGGDSTIMTAHHKAAASGKDVLKRISTIGAELQHAPVEADVGIDLRRFQTKVVPE
jgi:hypothetical protein